MEEPIVRAADVGRRNVKYTAEVENAIAQCEWFPTQAIPCARQTASQAWIGGSRRTVDIPDDGQF